MKMHTVEEVEKIKQSYEKKIDELERELKGTSYSLNQLRDMYNNKIKEHNNKITEQLREISSNCTKCYKEFNKKDM